MNYEMFEPKFGSWAPYFRDFIESKEFDNIFKTLKALKPNGRIACPANHQTFRCFSETPYDQLKAVFVFGSAYSTIENNCLQADGLALSCSNTGMITPALDKFYQGIGGSFLDSCYDPDLTYLANQGILLLNASLTVELHKPGSHLELWKPFMDYLFREIINRYAKILPIVFFGHSAAQYERLAMPFHKIFKLEDPAKESSEDWKTHGTFNIVDKIVKDTYPYFSGFRWLCDQPAVA